MGEMLKIMQLHQIMRLRGWKARIQRRNSVLNQEDNEMLPEHDFASDICGKYFRAYQSDHKAIIHRIDRNRSGVIGLSRNGLTTTKGS